MKKKIPAAIAYEPTLLEDLKNVNFAAQYLTDCLRGFDDDSFELFFSALLEICRANGISLTAKKSKMTRDAFYKAFKKHQNPTLKTFRNVLRSVDLDIQIVPHVK